MYRRLVASFDRKIISKLSLYLLASFISSGLNVLINPFLAINLSASDYAVIGYFVSLNTLFMPLISFKLDSYYSRMYYKVSSDELEVLRNTILSFQIMFGGLFSGLIILIFYFYAVITNLSFDIFPYVLLSVGSIFFGMFLSFLLKEKRLKGNAKSFFIFIMISLVINISLALFFVVGIKWGATGRLSGMFVTSFLTAIIALFNIKFKFSIDYIVLKQSLRFSWPILFTALLYFAFGGYDRILLEKLGDNESLGIYNVAFQITTYVGVLGTVLIQTFEPNIYKATAKNEIKKALGIMLLVFIIMAIVCLVFNYLAYFVIDILTFGKYVNAVPYAKILVYRNAAIILAFMSSDILVALGYPKTELFNRVIGSILVLMGFKLIIDEYGYVGAAWGQTFALLFMSLISILTLFFIMTKIKLVKNAK